MKYIKHIYNKYSKKYGSIKINVMITIFICLFILIIIIIIIFTNNGENKSCFNGNTHIYFTNYWIPKEGTKDMLNNGKIIYLNGSKETYIKDKNNNIIEKVSKNTYDKCQMEGTCFLNNNKLINLDSNKNIFKIVNINKFPYGIGSNNNPLYPFVSIASNDFVFGETLYIKELDGIKLPNGIIHNGCVRVDDEGWSLKKCQIDFFILRYKYYEYFQKHIVKNKVTAKLIKCNILNY